MVFRWALKKLLKHKNDYASCAKDLCDKINNSTIDELRQIGTEISPGRNYTIRKFRLHNTQKRQGARSSFRVYIAVHKELDQIILMTIYSKTGPEKKEKLEPDVERDLYLNLKREIDNNTFVELDLKKELAELAAQ